MENLIFEKSVPGRRGVRFPGAGLKKPSDSLPSDCLRSQPPRLPEVSELDVVRHFTRLSQLNYSVDTHFYPLGSCTMKYNPKVNEEIASSASFSGIHPFQPYDTVQGTLEMLYELEKTLCSLTGMDAFTLQPSAGAQGELLGILITGAYFKQRGDNGRTEVLIPDSAHGTNPASATLGSFSVVGIASNKSGRVDLGNLKERLGPKTALVMLTVPNTLGLFENEILDISKAVHDAGALVYMAGANFNALMGLMKPGDFGADILHLNAHKTFSTPHGGGGPGAGPVGVKNVLAGFLPVPRVVKEGGMYLLKEDFPDSIGRVRAFLGNVGVLTKAYCYLKMHSPSDLRKVAQASIINANYLRALLKSRFPSFVDEPCMHECVLQTDTKSLNGIRTMDIAKRLLDYGFYAPTIYFPLIVPEALMIEPTETESRQTLDAFSRAMISIADEAGNNPEIVKNSPHTTPVRRLDEVRAAREPNLRHSS